MSHVKSAAVSEESHTIPEVNTSATLYSGDVEDVSVQADLQPWIEMEYYQMESGSKVATVEVLDLGGQQLVRESQKVAVQKLGSTPADLCTISWNTPDHTFRFSENGSATTDSIFFMPADTEFDIYVPAEVKTTYFSFSQSAFLQGARALAPHIWESEPKSITLLPAAEQALLANLVDGWLNPQGNEAAPGEPESGFCSDRLSEQILQAVLQITAASQPDEWRASSSAERVRASSICQMARAYIDECFILSNIPTITDICLSLKVSERTLQYAFRRYVDMSPYAYLRICRFNQVRSYLRISDPQLTTVTKIAMKFGFLHLGRFSADYKKLFGEAPSVTLGT